MLAHILQVAAKCAALRTFTKRQTVLVELIDLSLLGKQARWTVVAKETGLEPLPKGLIAGKAVLRRVTDFLARAAVRGRANIDGLKGADKLSEDILVENVKNLKTYLRVIGVQKARKDNLDPAAYECSAGCQQHCSWEITHRP